MSLEWKWRLRRFGRKWTSSPEWAADAKVLRREKPAPLEKLMWEEEVGSEK